MLRLGRCTPFLVVLFGVFHTSQELMTVFHTSQELMTVFHTSQELMTEINLGGVLIGMIRSPNFPNSYPRGVERFWTVVAPVGNRIKATFNAFHLGECGNRKCNISFDCDMLEVRDGALNTSKMIGRFCGNRRPNGFYSSGNVLWIRFKSSIKPTNGSLGFEAIFSTENMVLASVLLIIGCILLLCVIIALLIIIKRRRSAELNSSASNYRSIDDTLSRNETESLPMKTRNNLENELSFSGQHEHSIPVLSHDSGEQL